MTMMHRYVIAVRTGSPLDFRETATRIGRDLQGFAKVLDHAIAKAWVFQCAPSQLGHRSLGLSGTLIGLDANSAVGDFDALIGRSWGSYVAIAAEAGPERIRILRDPTGRIEAWRLSLRAADLIFSHYQDVHHLPRRPPEVDWAFLGHHLNQDYLHGAATCLEGVSELLPGEMLTYEHGAARTSAAWSHHLVAQSPHETPRLAQAALRSSAEIGVAFWAERYRRATLDLSGGLDSAIMLGLLMTQQRRPELVATNRNTPGEEGDERPYARAAAARYGVELYEQIPSSPDVELATPFPRKLMRPRARLLPLGYDEMGAELARRFQAEAFFTGTGGDHLFYDHLPANAAADYFRHGGSLRRYPKVAVALAQLAADTVWGVTAAAARAARLPALSEVGVMPNPLLSHEGRAAADFETYAHPEIRSAIGKVGPAKLQQIANLIELQRHYYRYGRAEAAEEVHAFFAQPLLEASLRTPAPWFGQGGMQRGLARAAFADLLPEIIRERRSKGSNAVYFIEFLQQRLPRIRELLFGGRLMARGLLDRASLEQATTTLGISSGRWFLSLNISLTAELWVRQAESDAASVHAERPQELAV